jgi:hypothetical protein
MVSFCGKGFDLHTRPEVGPVQSSMTSSRILAVLCGILLLSSCTPLMVARTPKPVPVGVTRATDVLAWSFQNVPPIPPDPCVDPSTGCFPRGFEAFIPTGIPFPLTAPFGITWTSGVDETTDESFGLQAILFYGPGLRYGRKTLLIDGPVLLALDYGASFYWSNLGFDAGLIVSVPLEGWEPYLALKGYGNLNWVYLGGSGVISLFDASATLGSRIAVGEHDVFLELTIATMRARYDGQSEVLGFSLTPAIAWRW